MKISSVNGFPTIYIGTEFTIEEFTFKGRFTTNIYEKNLYNFNIYPNPTKNDIQYKLDNSLQNNLSYNLIDSQGKLLRTADIKSNGGIINLHEFCAGTYFISLIKDGSQSIFWQKLIIVED
jgi:hypothetical protein